jgi:hypothetical protein
VVPPSKRIYTPAGVVCKVRGWVFVDHGRGTREGECEARCRGSTLPRAHMISSTLFCPGDNLHPNCDKPCQQLTIFQTFAPPFATRGPPCMRNRSSSIHGYNRIPTSHAPLRFIWSTVVAVGWIISLFSIWQLWNEYKQYPYSTNVEIASSNVVRASPRSRC